MISVITGIKMFYFYIIPVGGCENVFIITWIDHQFYNIFMYVVNIYVFYVTFDVPESTNWK